MSRRDEPALWRLFDTTVCAEYERRLTLAKQQIGPLPTTPGGRTALPLIDGDWRQVPAIKARLAGGYCLRAEAQGASPYANICEHCPGFRADPRHLAVLAAQRVEARARPPTLAAGAPKRTGTAGSPSDSTLSSPRPRQDDPHGRQV